MDVLKCMVLSQALESGLHPHKARFHHCSYLSPTMRGTPKYKDKTNGRQNWVKDSDSLICQFIPIPQECDSGQG